MFSKRLYKSSEAVCPLAAERGTHVTANLSYCKMMISDKYRTAFIFSIGSTLVKVYLNIMED